VLSLFFPPSFFLCRFFVSFPLSKRSYVALFTIVLPFTLAERSNLELCSSWVNLVPPFTDSDSLPDVMFSLSIHVAGLSPFRIEYFFYFCRFLGPPHRATEGVSFLFKKALFRAAFPPLLQCLSRLAFPLYCPRSPSGVTPLTRPSMK